MWAPVEDVEAGRADYAALVGPPLIKFYEDTYGIKWNPCYSFVFFILCASNWFQADTFYFPDTHSPRWTCCHKLTSQEWQWRFGRKVFLKIGFSLIWPELGPHVIWDAWPADWPKQYKCGCQVDVLLPILIKSLKSDQCTVPPSGSGFWTWLPTSWRTSGSATLSRWTGGSFWTVASKLHGWGFVSMICHISVRWEY